MSLHNFSENPGRHVEHSAINFSLNRRWQFYWHVNSHPFLFHNFYCSNMNFKFVCADAEWVGRSTMLFLDVRSRLGFANSFAFVFLLRVSLEFPYEDNFIENHRLNPDAGQKYLHNKTALVWIKILSKFLFSCRRLLVNRSRQQPATPSDSDTAGFICFRRFPTLNKAGRHTLRESLNQLARFRAWHGQ